MEELRVVRILCRKQAERLRIQREEIRALRKKIDEADEKRDKYEETTSCVARMWDRLQEDVELIARRAGSNAQAGPRDEGAMDDSSAGGAKADQLDPFLQRLLRGRPLREEGSSSRKRKRGADAPVVEMGELESLLRARFARTQQALSAALALAEAAGGSAGTDLLAEADAAAARAIAAEERAAQLSVALEREELESSRLRGEAATLEEQLDQARRDVERARAEAERARVEQPLGEGLHVSVPGDASRPGTPHPTPGSRTPRNTDGADAQGLPAADGEAQRKVQEELEAEMRDLRAARDEVVSRLEEQVARLEKERREAERRAEGQRRDAALGQFTDELRTLEAAWTKRLLGKLDDVSNTLRIRVSVFDLERDRLKSELDAAQGEVARMRTERARLSGQLEELKAQIPSSQTRDALRAEVGRLSGENASLRRHLSAAKQRLRQGADLHAAAGEVAAARRELGAEQGPLFVARAQLKEAQARVAALEKDAEEARSAERRHRAFLDVLTATCGDDLDTAKGHAEAAELRKEVERLREEVAGLRGGAEVTRLEGRVREVEAELTAAREQCSKLEAVNEQLEAAREEAASALLAAQEESATYLKEVEAVGSEYERVQGQARDLLASVAALDENVAGLEKDKARLGEELAAAAGDVTRAREESDRQARLLAEADKYVAEVWAALEALGADLRGLREGLRGQVANDAERARVEGEASVLRETVAAMKREVEAAVEEAEKAKAEKERAVSEMKLALQKVMRLQGLLGSRDLQALERMEEEQRVTRNMIFCGLCRNNQKDRVITKCMHVFCKKCIDKNIKSRSRKCPSCNTPFAESDVRPIFLK